MIKNWKEYNEAANGTELFGRGPNFQEQKLPNTLSTKDQSYLIGIDGNFYNESDFMDLYDELLKSYKLDPNTKVFNQSNLDFLIKIVIDNKLIV